MKIKSRHDSHGEKCPFCLQIFVNFIDLGDDLLACLKCGSVFVAKEKRQDLRDHQAEMIAEQKKESEINFPPGKTHIVENIVVPENLFVCPCGFEAKSKAGLAAHQRTCVMLIERESSSG
jgi:hypothetical protein